MALVSVRQCAEVLGISHTALNKQIKSGVIKTTDGKVDPDEVRKQRTANLNRRQQRPKADPLAKAGEPSSSKSAGRLATPGEATRSPTQNGEGRSRKPPELEDADDGTFYEAQRHLEWEKVRKAKLQNDKLEGKLIDREEVEAAIEARFRADAEAMLNWPARVASNLAFDLGTDERKTYEVLEKHVRQFMRERSSVPANLATTGEAAGPTS